MPLAEIGQFSRIDFNYIFLGSAGGTIAILVFIAGTCYGVDPALEIKGFLIGVAIEIAMEGSRSANENALFL